MAEPVKVWPPGYKPKPLEVKESLVEDEVAWRDEVGLEKGDVASLEADWRDSLERVDVHEARSKPEPPPAPIPLEETPAAKMAANMGYVLEKRELTMADLAQEQARPKPYALHTAKSRGMSMRVSALTQTDAASGAPLYPKFALMIQALKHCYAKETSNFQGKSRKDMKRIVAAELEKICDLSKFETALGEWF